MSQIFSNDAPAPLERHPWEPFIPEGAKVLIMGTFPPGPHRWSMDFYYPKRLLEGLRAPLFRLAGRSPRRKGLQSPENKGHALG